MQPLHSSELDRRGWLHQCSLFRDLPAPDLEALSRIALLRQYGAGEILFFSGDQADGFYVITEGEIKVGRHGVDGREQVLHVIGSSEPCGEATVFAGKTFPATATAVVTTRALFIERNAFLGLAREHPEMLLNMLSVLSIRLRRFVRLIDDLSLKEVSARVAAHLLVLAGKTESETVTLTSSKAMLASRLGTIAETLSRTLSRMQKQGVVAVNGKTITILDYDALADLADGEKL